MKETWRWFGPDDEIHLHEILQTGAKGIVSALHHVATGAVWSPEEIRHRKQLIEGSPDRPTGLTWDVVESLPVSEAIKTQGPGWRDHIATYQQSLRNLADAGIEVVCYNFMPVLDWTRTQLSAPVAGGGTTMRFDLIEFAVFDLHVLERPGADQDYPEDIRDAARRMFRGQGDVLGPHLVQTILAGLPGAAEHWGLDDVRRVLATYSGVDDRVLRRNLATFLEQVVPLAEELGLRLCCHPDDPPFPLLGLPRIVSTEDDYAELVAAVDSPANGITMCTGSLGVRPDFDPARFVERLGPHIHFVHLRNTTREIMQLGRCSFAESAHLEGDTDMVAAIRALLAEQARRKAEGRTDWQIPMRPDHGQSLLSDLDRPMMPGYPLIGRMRGLAELRGIMAACAT